MIFSRHSMLVLLVSAILQTTIGVAAAEDWLRFRGPAGLGLAPKLSIPTKNEPEAILWKVEVDPGTSSPLIIGEKIILTSHQDDQRTIRCLNSEDGVVRWSRSITSSHKEPSTRPSGPDTPTPVCDGKHVWALFPDAGLVCFDMDGTLVWEKPLGPFHSMHGISSSLVLADGRLIVCIDQLRDSYLVAYDAGTGDEVWQVKRHDGLTGGYSTPTIVSRSGDASMIVAVGPLALTAYDATDGRKLWEIPGVASAPITLPLVVDGHVILCEPVGEAIPFSMFSRYDSDKDNVLTLEEVKKDVAISRLLESLDKKWGDGDKKVNEAEWDRAFGTLVDRGGLMSVQLSEPDSKTTPIRWRYRKSVPYIASPIVVGPFVYFVQDGGILTSLELKTGKVVKRARLTSGGKQYYASPVAGGQADDQKMLLVNTEGRCTVIQCGKDWSELGSFELGEACFSTPAISNGRAYIRTRGHLFCVGR
ncbi:MAG TPA: hypothetical protein EYG57_08855 [Planctomycetes bacterium]|nr:hypothetical protein [Planctomycetota bacterium]